MSCNDKINCTCTYPCDKHGKCCECVEFHRKNEEVPGCFFSEAGEKTYDRSVRNLSVDRAKN